MFSSEDEGREGCGALTGTGWVSRVRIISLLSVLMLVARLFEVLVIAFLSLEKSNVVFAISDLLDSIGIGLVL